MFSLLNSLVKASVGVVVETPLALIADTVTLGGALTDKEVPYTAEALEKILKNLKESTE